MPYIDKINLGGAEYDVSVCVSGHYTGTGNYGENNKNSLTFTFAPKMIIIMNAAIYAKRAAFINPGIRALCVKADDNTETLTAYSDSQVWALVTSINDNTVTWYSSISAAAQMNTDSNTYYYVAYG